MFVCFMLGKTGIGRYETIIAIAEKIIYNWKAAHSSFFQSLKAGKQLADADVADRLFQRAIGYSHPDVHISKYQGAVTILPITRH